MAFQTTITRSLVQGVEGMAVLPEDIRSSSKIAKTTLAPGRAVRVDTADAFDQVTVPTSAAQVTGDATNNTVMGVTLFDTTALTNPYVAGDPVPVVRTGVLLVLSEAVTDPSLPVYIRHTANGGNTIIGGFSSAAGTGLALAPVGTFRWLTKTTAVNSFAQLAINLP